LALASSRFNRAFSASSSLGPRLMALTTPLGSGCGVARF
jgi:hypothetical protein